MSPSDAPVWRRGLVKAVDGTKARVRVELPDEDGLVTDWLPVLQGLALGGRSFRLPRVGSQVVTLLDEHGEDGVVLGAIYSQADPPPASDALVVHLELEDGTRLILDPGTRTVTVETPGHLIARCGLDAQVEAPQITLKGAVKVDGTLQVTGAATLQQTLSVAQDATVSGKSFLAHRHTAQGATAPTTPPN